MHVSKKIDSWLHIYRENIGDDLLMFEPKSKQYGRCDMITTQRIRTPTEATQ